MGWSVAALMLLFLAEDANQAGLASYRNREYAKAAQQFEAAIQDRKPGSSEYQETALLLGQSLFLTSKFDQAIPWLEKAGTRRLEAEYMLGSAYLQTQQWDKSVEAFSRMFEVPSGSAPAHLLTAQMMVRFGFEDAAGKELAKAIAVDPKIPQAHYVLGELATYHGQIDEAIAELKKEIALNPNFAMAYYKLGDAYSRREQWQEAIPNLERSIWLNPTYSGPYILLGKGYFKLQNLSEAEKMLKQALKMDPQNLSAHYLLAQTLTKLGRAEEATQVLARWQELEKQK